MTLASTRGSPPSARPRHRRHRPEDDPNMRRSSRRGTPVVTIFGKSWTAARDRGAAARRWTRTCAMIERLGRLPARPASARSIYDAEHFFDGYKADPRLRARDAACGARGRRRHASSCATPTAAPCPTRSRRSSLTSSRRSSSATRPHRHPRPQRRRAAPWPTRWRRCAPACATSRARSTATASAAATPTS